MFSIDFNNDTCKIINGIIECNIDCVDSLCFSIFNPSVSIKTRVRDKTSEWGEDTGGYRELIL